MDMPKYATRAKRTTFFDRYSSGITMDKVEHRDMYRYLTNDNSEAHTSSELAINDRMSRLLETNDTNIVVGLRVLNGHPLSTKFDAFWTALDQYFNEQILAAQEGRHGEHLHMPFATSVEELVDTITQKLPAGTLIPSAEWVQLQFWPTNTTTDRALKHTGRFKVKMKVQSRQIRGWHEDTRYVLKQIMYMKEFTVLYREHALLLWEYDKAMVPIGEPAKPVGTGVRSNNKSLVD